MSVYYRISIREVSPLDVLYYEIEMLNRTPITKTGNPVRDNVRIESFLLHARNLFEFLRNEGHLKCSQFDDLNGKRINQIVVNSKNLKDLIKKLNEHLSHISKKRTTEKMEWGASFIRKKINQGLVMFFSRLSHSYFPTIGGKKRKDFEDLLKE